MDPSAPFLPSDLEAANFYYGLESKPILVARSDRDVCVPSQGPYVYVAAKVLTPLGPHLLNRAWDETVSVAMESYLQEQGVQYTGMTPLRIGVDGQASPPAVIFMGVRHGSLTREKGYEVAVHCHSILVQNDITDIHVQIRESEASLSAASLFRPAITANGTGGFYFTRNGKLFVFDPNAVKNEQYEYKDGTGVRRINVMFLDKAAFNARVQDIQDKINERKAVQREMDETLKEAIGMFERLQKDVKRDWADETKRIIGHVVFSPRLDFRAVRQGIRSPPQATQRRFDPLATLQRRLTRRHFVGNAIDLGHVTAADFKKLMYSHPAHSFDYPGDRLHRCRGILSDKDMPMKDQDNERTIMAIQNGNVSRLQVGRVNNIRSVVRRYYENLRLRFRLPVCGFAIEPVS
ncbi:hypothetical protein EW026_g6049 [Hermanssonia centrifuga]|uniref:Uncharacterized protein n=1 Tax=Hermanssonia centrifuga TaxID=98765 RepID=A0A4S4KCA0_9APHY|nr:hypothetical protein EW026_g6049 [Hermanssonia centrifuga]